MAYGDMLTSESISTIQSNIIHACKHHKNDVLEKYAKLASFQSPKNGTTPLMICITHNNHIGANILKHTKFLKNNLGETAYDVAVRYNNGIFYSYLKCDSYEQSHNMNNQSITPKEICNNLNYALKMYSQNNTIKTLSAMTLSMDDLIIPISDVSHEVELEQMRVMRNSLEEERQQIVVMRNSLEKERERLVTLRQSIDESYNITTTNNLYVYSNGMSLYNDSLFEGSNYVSKCITPKFVSSSYEDPVQMHSNGTFVVYTNPPIVISGGKKISLC